MNGEADILAGITVAEQEIQGRIDAERRMAAESLESLRHLASQELVREESRLARELEAGLALARSEGEKTAAALVAAEHWRAKRLAALSDETLIQAVMAYLPRILPKGTP